MSGQKRPRVRNRAVLDAAAGAAAGCVARFVVGPLDVLKIRFQVSNHLLTSLLTFIPNCLLVTDGRSGSVHLIANVWQHSTSAHRVPSRSQTVSRQSAEGCL